MSAKVTVEMLRTRIAAQADVLAADLLPPDSLARYAYDNKPYPEIRKDHTPADADKAECEKWQLTRQEWAEEMNAARYAMAHDMKLDLIKEGFF